MDINEEHKDLEEELKEWMEYGPHTNFPWCTIPDAIEITARHFADWQREKDYKMHAHVSLRDIHDAWQELIKNNPDIRNTPGVCFARGADWQKEQDKETIELAEDHAMLAGMNKMSEMIKNKIEERQKYLEEHNFHSMVEELDNLLSML